MKLPTKKQIESMSISELADLKFLVTETIKEKKARQPKGTPGFQGDQISKAFEAIPSTPILASEFCEKHGIAFNSLRQTKRFDNTGLKKPVNVRKPHHHGEYYVWRGDKNILKDWYLKNKLK